MLQKCLDHGIKTQPPNMQNFKKSLRNYSNIIKTSRDSVRHREIRNGKIKSKCKKNQKTWRQFKFGFSPNIRYSLCFWTSNRNRWMSLDTSTVSAEFISNKYIDSHFLFSPFFPLLFPMSNVHLFLTYSPLFFRNPPSEFFFPI